MRGPHACLRALQDAFSVTGSRVWFICRIPRARQAERLSHEPQLRTFTCRKPDVMKLSGAASFLQALSLYIKHVPPVRGRLAALVFGGVPALIAVKNQ